LSKQPKIAKSEFFNQLMASSKIITSYQKLMILILILT